jgi:hypothetical protein
MKKLILTVAAILTVTTSALAQIGSSSSDLVYTPVTPCRILDTRVSQGGTGSIAAAGTKDFVIWGASSYAGQGGAATNCGITAGANTAAVAVNLTVVTPTTAGYITAYPAGTSKPLAATVNFNAGDVRGNFAVVKNAQSGSGTDLSIFSTSIVDVVGDVVGFYSKPAITALECESLTASALVPANGTGSAVKACSAGFTMTGGGCDHGTADGTLLVAKTVWSTDYSGWFCRWQNTTAADAYGFVRARCCRVPGR